MSTKGSRYKVLFAINNFGIGGAEMLMLEQAKAINRTQFEPCLLSLYTNPKNNLLKDIPSNIQHHQCNFSGLLDIRSWLKLIRFMRRERYDAVITNLFDTNVVVRTASVLCRVPIIMCYEHNVYREKRRWQILVDKLLARWTATIFVVSKQVRDFTIEQERIPAEKFVINHNAAKLIFGDVTKDRNKILHDLDLDPECVYITTAGRLVEQKGHIYLIEAASRLVPKYPMIRFLIFGEGALRNVLQKKIEEYGLTEAIRLMGIGTPRDIAAVSDIFAFPSLWEGLSIALINTMDAGRPIVATNVSGTEELINDGENGLLVEPKDVSGLVASIEDLIAHPDKAATLGRSAQQRATLFSIEKNIEVIEQAIMSAARM